MLDLPRVQHRELRNPVVPPNQSKAVPGHTNNRPDPSRAKGEPSSQTGHNDPGEPPEKHTGDQAQAGLENPHTQGTRDDQRKSRTGTGHAPNTVSKYLKLPHDHIPRRMSSLPNPRAARKQSKKLNQHGHNRARQNKNRITANADDPEKKSRPKPRQFPPRTLATLPRRLRRTSRDPQDSSVSEVSPPAQYHEPVSLAVRRETPR